MVSSDKESIVTIFDNLSIDMVLGLHPVMSVVGFMWLLCNVSKVWIEMWAVGALHIESPIGLLGRAGFEYLIKVYYSIPH